MIREGESIFHDGVSILQYSMLYQFCHFNVGSVAWFAYLVKQLTDRMHKNTER